MPACQWGDSWLCAFARRGNKNQWQPVAIIRLQGSREQGFLQGKGEQKC